MQATQSIMGRKEGGKKEGLYREHALIPQEEEEEEEELPKHQQNNNEERGLDAADTTHKHGNLRSSGTGGET